MSNFRKTTACVAAWALVLAVSAQPLSAQVTAVRVQAPLGNAGAAVSGAALSLNQGLTPSVGLLNVGTSLPNLGKTTLAAPSLSIAPQTGASLTAPKLVMPAARAAVMPALKTGAVGYTTPSLALPKAQALAPAARKTGTGALGTLKAGVRMIGSALTSGGVQSAVGAVRKFYDRTRAGADDSVEPTQPAATEPAVEPATKTQPEEAPFEAQLVFALKVPGQILQVAYSMAQKKGYTPDTMTPAQREEVFDEAVAMLREQAGKISPSPEALEAAVAVFGQVRRIIAQSEEAYPSLNITNNYVFAEAMQSLVERGQHAKSFEELQAIAQDVADHALDLSAVEPAYVKSTLQTLSKFVQQYAEAMGIGKVETPAEYADLIASGLTEFRSDGEFGAPSQAAFEASLKVAEAYVRIVKAAAETAPGMGEMMKMLQSEAAQEWGKALMGLKTLADVDAVAGAAADKAVADMKAMEAELPMWWAQGAMGRMNAELGKLVESRQVDPNTLTVQGFVDLLKEAMAAVKAQPAPYPEAVEAADAVMENYIRIHEAFVPHAELYAQLVQGMQYQLMMQMLWGQAINAAKTLDELKANTTAAADQLVEMLKPKEEPPAPSQPEEPQS